MLSQVGVSSRGGNQVHKTSVRSPGTTMSIQSRRGLKRDMYKVRTGVICSYGINTCTPIPQGHQSTGGMYPETLDNPDTSFSDPIDISSSDVESFDEDDMYGSDHGMEIVSESSDEEQAEMSQFSENRMVGA